MANEIGGKTVLLQAKTGVSGAVTFQDAGDTVTKVAHGKNNGDVVQFSVITGTTGITTGTNYFVINKTADTFQLTSTIFGSPIALTTDGTGTLDDVFQTFGGLRSKSLTVSSESVDVTNHDSDEWSAKLDGAGIRSAAISGECVLIDNHAVINKIRTNFLANVNTELRIVASVSGSYYQGMFKLTEFGLSGDYNGEATTSISAESSGAVTYTAV